MEKRLVFLEANETGIPFIFMGGVVNNNLTGLIDDKEKITRYNDVVNYFYQNTHGSFEELKDAAKKKGITNLGEWLFDILQSFLSGGKFLENVNVPINMESLKQGLITELEHCDPKNPISQIMANKIARDHLAEDARYYEKLDKAGL